MEGNMTTEEMLAEALEETLTALRALRGIAFTGSRTPYERIPERNQADEADRKATAALTQYMNRAKTMP